jgi:DNA invertase Pin-like site-specific DNA recombinase
MKGAKIMSDHSMPPPTAYSYIRFSSKQQADGDSLRRQTEKAAAYCHRHGWNLDTALNLRDLGVSAFRGKNALVGNLKVFLDEVKRGTVRPGSVLIVESIDRISRQGIDEGYDLIKGILKAGILLVTLSPERLFDVEATKSLSKGSLEILLILERAAEESERKSERVGAARAQERKCIRDHKTVATHRLPGWIEERGGKLHLIPKAAAAVQTVFALAAGGYGVPTITKKLNDDGVPPIGREKYWTRSYVGLLLRDRRVVGEYQPRRGKDKDGDVVTGYYPGAVSEDEWYRARAGVVARRRYHGRIATKGINIFAGILKHARDGDNFFMTQRLSRTRGKADRTFAILLNHKGDDGRAPQASIPYDGFEAAVLSCLREIDPHEILNGDTGPDETIVLAGELAGIEAREAEIEAELLNGGDVAVLAKVARKLAEQKQAKAEELAEARLKAAHPLSETWGEAQSLIDALKNAPDPRDARLRLRSAIRRMVESMHLLIVMRGRDRLCAVQIWFSGGKRHRDYLIRHQAAGFHREEAWWVRSWNDETLRQCKMPTQFDLRHKTPTMLGADDEGHSAWAAGWGDVEVDLLAADMELLFAGCPKHPLP